MGIIIYPPTIDWNWMKQRPQHLMYQLAKNGHLVFYCNQSQTTQPLEKIHPNLFIVHNHEHWLRHELVITRKEHSFVGVWCSYPKLASTLSSYQPNWIVYDYIDDFPEWSPYENEMATISQAIVCSAKRLFSKIKKTYPDKNVLLIRNAYDADMGLHTHTISTPPPPDLIKGSIIGYIGAWAPWVDEKLVQKISSIDTSLSVVIIGPEFGGIFSKNKSPNLHFLGIKPHHLLPEYIKHFSLCIIPFRITSVTLATNPVKAYEYLASGKPIISTDLPECRLMEPHIDIAQNHTQFIKQVEQRIQNPGDPLPRVEYALNNTWSQRYQQIETLIRTLSQTI